MLDKIFVHNRKVNNRRRGDQCRDARDWLGASAAYTRHLEQNDDDQPIWVQLGHAYKEQGQLEKAAQAYQKAVDLNTADIDAHTHLADILRRLGQQDANLDDIIFRWTMPHQDVSASINRITSDANENRLLRKLILESKIRNQEVSAEMKKVKFNQKRSTAIDNNALDNSDEQNLDNETLHRHLSAYQFKLFSQSQILRIKPN